MVQQLRAQIAVEGLGLAAHNRLQLQFQGILGHHLVSGTPGHSDAHTERNHMHMYTNKNEIILF